jgi:hypothetical protein
VSRAQIDRAAPGTIVQDRRIRLKRAKDRVAFHERDIPLKAKLDVPDEVAAQQYRQQQAQQLIDRYKAGTLREFFREQHPEWSAEEIECRATEIEAYFDARKV